MQVIDSCREGYPTLHIFFNIPGSTIKTFQNVHNTF